MKILTGWLVTMLDLQKKKEKKKKRNQDRIVCMGAYSSSDQLQDKKRVFSEKPQIKQV